MWLKQLKIKNFQKHEDLTLDFTPGVNIIYGSSDAGKSCIRRAIGFVFFGDPRTDDVIRKEGTKQTSVCAVLDDDTEVERVKSASINRYVIRRPGQKDRPFDSIGAEIPEEVASVLQVKLVEIDKLNLNLNIAEQVSLPFLTGTDFPASARLKLFNKLTGNDLLDVVVQNFNKEIIATRRNITVEQNVVLDNTPKIEQLGKLVETKKVTADFIREKLVNIGHLYRKLTDLKELQTSLYATRMAIKATQGDLEAIKLGDEARITSLKAQTTILGALSTLKEALHLVSNKLYLTKNQLSTIKIPVIDAVTNVRTIEKLFNLVKIQHQLKELMVKNQQIINEKHLIESSIPLREKEYSDILKEAKICPTCKQETSKCEVHL